MILTENLVRQILLLKDSGRSLRKIAHKTGLSKSHVQRLIDDAKAANISSATIATMTDEAVREVFIPSRRGVLNFVEPDWEFIYCEHSRPHRSVTLRVLWEDYVRDVESKGSGKALSYSSFCRAYDEFTKGLPPKLEELSMTFHWEPGEIAMIDYSGDGLYYQTPAGKQVKVEIFVGVLASSGYVFCTATPDQKRESWLDSIANMLKFFGGVPECILLDNSTSLVKRADWVEPQFCDEFKSQARFFGFYPDATRPGKPRDKGLVENAVKQVQNYILNPLLSNQFHSLKEINECIAERLELLNDRKMSERFDSRKQRFLEEQAFLRGLPLTPYEPNLIEKTLKVRPDYRIRFENRRFSVPSEYAGQFVLVHIFPQSGQLDCFDISTGERIAHHNYGKNSTAKDFMDTTHMPAAHKVMIRTKENLIEMLSLNGPETKKFSETVAKQNNSRVARRKLTQLESISRVIGSTLMEKICRELNSRPEPNYEKFCQEVDAIRSPTPTETQEISIGKGVKLRVPKQKKNVRGAEYYRKEAAE